jgi:hypothetical protein
MNLFHTFAAHCMYTALILFIHVGILEYLSFKQFLIDWQNNNMHVKMTRIESVVTVPKDLFTLYVNVKL